MSAVSILGPFPTSFAPDGSCTAVSSEDVVGIDFATTCLPKKFNHATNAYYSPGTVCPSGYTAQKACTRSSGSSTTITCCPVRTNIDVTMQCVTDAAKLSSVWKEMLCTWSAGNDETVILVTTVSNGTTEVPAITMSGGDGINAYGLKMIYEASDLTTSTSAASTSAETSEETGAAATTSPAANDDSSSSGISTGAKAAIGVVIPLVVIAVLLGVFFWYRRRKQRYGAVNAAATDDDAHKDIKELPPNNTISELYGTQQSPPSELAAPAIVSELPADVPMTHMSPTSGYLSTTASPSPALSNSAVSKADTSSPEFKHSVPHS